MTPIKNITFGEETRQKMLAGVLTLAEAVGSTLGPMGKNVVIETPYGATTVTKDGVTVAKHIDLDDPVENLGAQILKQAASRTATLAGDGTTTATVIAAALVKGAHKLISAGVQPIEIKRRFEQLSLDTQVKIRAEAKEVNLDKIKEIATISANNDEELGEIIQQAYEYVGAQGLISLTESKTGITHLELLPGVSVDRGFASPFFVNNSVKGEVQLDNALVFITDGKLRHTQEVVPLLEIAVKANRPLLIIADEIDGQALQLLVINKMRGVVPVAAITAPSYGENRSDLLKDLAALTSATVLSTSESARVEDAKLSQMGSVERIIISKYKTMFISPKRDEARIEDRVKDAQSKLTGEGDHFLEKQVQKRIADLTAKVALLHVGAATETELKERKDRVDDALRATAAAVQKGYLVGGGTALARIAHSIKQTSPLIDPIFVKALQQPLLTIADNAGEPSEVILAKTLESKKEAWGFNAKTLLFGNLLEQGVIDPALVVEQAVVNAVSAANMIILSSTSLTNKDRTPPYNPGNLEDYAG